MPAIATPILPTEQDARQARDCSGKLSDVVSSGGAADLRVTSNDGRALEMRLPLSATQVLVRVLQEMGQGNGVTITPVRKELTALQVARDIPDDGWAQVVWREGTKGPMQSRFAAVRVEPSHGETRGTEAEPASWLLIEWPRQSEEPTKYFLSSLPEDTTLQQLVYWAKIRWWIEQGYQHLKDELGLDHFEGRSWRGRHHHVTLTLMAFAFLALERLRQRKLYWVDPPSRQEGDTADAARAAWVLSSLQTPAAGG